MSPVTLASRISAAQTINVDEQYDSEAWIAAAAAAAIDGDGSGGDGDCGAPQPPLSSENCCFAIRASRAASSAIASEMLEKSKVMSHNDDKDCKSDASRDYTDNLSATLRRFLLSMTLQDCSVMIALQREESSRFAEISLALLKSPFSCCYSSLLSSSSLS